MIVGMATEALERNFSDLLRKSGEVLEEVDRHDVLLRRRDGHDLLLVRADREETVRDAVEVASSVLAHMARRHLSEMAEGLPDALPWLRILPPGDLEQFAKEFIEVAEACGSLGSFDRLGLLLTEWRNTAYAWSRPEVLGALRTDHASEGFDEQVPSSR
jgi:hypothetical protein